MNMDNLMAKGKILAEWMFFVVIFCCFPHGKSTAESFHCGICVINWVLLKPTRYLRHITMAMAILSLHSLANSLLWKMGKWVVCR